ncbi:DUF4292 domain-containing protein [candidate division KSB1 bacterium]|nr:DUF4292 domain-containing protein [candidate division KSB1 bacterium]
MITKKCDSFAVVSWILLVSVFISISCSPSLRKKKLSVDQINPRELKDSVDRNFLNLQTLRGRARLQIQMKDFAYEANSEVKIRMPDSLFLKIEVIFGIDVGFFFGNREQFALYSPQDNIFYTGSIDSLDLSKFFQIDLTYDDLLEAFAGTPVIVPGKTTKIALDDGNYKLSSVTQNGLHRYWIDPDKSVIKKYQFYDRTGTLQIEKHYRRFKKYKDIYLPQIIQIKKPAKNQYFSLFYTSHEVNKNISPDEFQMNVPENARWIKL